MYYSNTTTQKAQQMVNIICCLLFVAFCLVYLGVYQADVLAFAQHVYSSGRTVYMPFVSLTVCTSLLTALGLAVGHYLCIPLRVRALAWVPSCLLLGLLTDVNIPEVFPERSGAPWWVYILLVGACLSSLGVAVRYRDSRNLFGSKLSFLTSNVVLMTLALSLVPMLGNTNEREHQLLAIERMVIDGRDREALELMSRYRPDSARLLPLEAYVLSRNGWMADSLFASGRFTSSRQLLPSYGDTLRPIALPHRLADHLGVSLDSVDIKSPIIFLHDATADTLAHVPVRDYLLMGYLLDGKLDNFVGYLSACTPTLTDSLPMVYREAIYLYNLDAERPVSVRDDSIHLRYAEYRRIADSEAGVDTLLSADSLALLCRKYAHSYWEYK